MRCPGYPYPSLVSGLGFRVPDCVTNVMIRTPLNSRSQMQDSTLHKGLSFDSGLRLQGFRVWGNPYQATKLFSHQSGENTSTSNPSYPNCRLESIRQNR